ncbi:MAG: hypothetical protein H6559_14250 [Lewinellaceae bacterium]|nr:hypothetical protein [Lewinellaceae bacterium]
MLEKDLNNVKIACVGNQNNMFFGLVRFLRERNYDAHLFLLNNEQPHFLPSCDSFDDKHKNYTHQLDWGSIDTFLKVSSRKIRSSFVGFDVFVATEEAIAFLNKAKIKIDIIFPSGTDLTLKTKVFQIMPYHSRLINPALYFFSKNMLRGFKQACCINQENSQPYYKNILTELGLLSKSYYYGCPMAYTKKFFEPGYDQVMASKSDYFLFFKKLRKENQLLIFYHNRLSWFFPEMNTDPNHNKGTDVLLKGFTNFIKANPGVKAKLIYLSYGKDIEKTRELIQKTNIQDHTIELPLLPKKELLLGLKHSDFGCGQFFTGGLGGGTTWETLAMGKPLLHYLEEDKIKFTGFDSPFPFVNVKNPEDISLVFEDFIAQPDKYRKIGEEAKQWHHRNFEKGSVDKWIELIEVKAQKGSEGLEAFVREKAREQQEKYHATRATSI